MKPKKLNKISKDLVIDNHEGAARTSSGRGGRRPTGEFSPERPPVLSAADLGLGGSTPGEPSDRVGAICRAARSNRDPPSLHPDPHSRTGGRSNPKTFRFSGSIRPFHFPEKGTHPSSPFNPGLGLHERSPVSLSPPGGLTRMCAPERSIMMGSAQNQIPWPAAVWSCGCRHSCG